MFNRLKNLLAPPVFADAEATRLASLLTVILRATFVAALVLTSILTLLEPGSDPLPRLATGAVAAIMILGLFVLMRTGRVRLVSVLMPSGLLAIVTVSVAQFGDIQGPVVAGYYVVIVVAGLLLGGRGSFVFTLFSMLATLGVLLMSMQGAPLNSPEVVTELNAWFIHAGLFSITAVLLSVAAGNIREGLENARRLFAEMQRRAEELERLNDLTRAALESADLPQLLQMLADRMGKLVNADGCFITLWDEARQAAIPAAASGPMRESYRTMPLEPGELTMTASVLRAGHVLIAEDVFHTPYMSPHVAAQFPTRSLLGLPLSAGGQRLGAALIGFDQPHHFTPDEIALGEQVARQIALAVAKARALEAERKRSAELETLRQASLRLTAQLELEPALQTILEQAMTLMRASNANLFLYNGERLTFGAALGLEGFTRRTYTEPRAEGVTYAVARSGERLIIPDVNRHPLFQNQPWGGAIISLPLAVGGQVRGVMNIAFDQPRPFDENELRFLDLLADQASVALEQARLFEAERRRAAQLSLLEEVSRQVAGTLDEQEIFQRTVTAIVNRFGFAEAAISLPVGGNQLELAAITGTEDLGFTSGFRQKVGDGIIGHVAETRAIYLTNDVGHDAYYFSSPGRQVGSALGLPMLREGQLMGVLYVESSSSNAFETDDVRTLETLANHIATALQNARLYALARDRLREMTALQSVSHTVASSLELSQIFQTVVQLLQDTFGYHYVSIYLLDGEVLHLGAQVGYPEELIYWEIPITTGITGRAVRTRQTQFVKDVTADPTFLPASYDLGSEVCVPLLKEQTVLGILNVEATHDRPLTEADVDLLVALAGPVTVAIDNARLFEAEREQRELAEALRQVGASLSGSLDVETVLDRLLDQIARVVAYDTANVMLVAEGRTRMARLRGYERFGEAVVQDTAALSFEVATTENLRRMADSGQPLIIPDTTAFPGWVRVKATDFIRSWAGAPIIAQGQVVAFFSIGKQELNFYQPEDAKRLAAFAGHAALALQNARLFEDTRRQVKELTVLQAVAAAGAEATDEDTLIERVTRVIGQMLYSDNFGVMLLDEAAGVLRPHPSYHAPAEVKERWKTVPLGHGVTGQVAREGQARRIPDVTCVPDYVVTEARMRSELCVPLKSGERIFGVINAESARVDDFNEADERLLMTIAGQLATAIQNLRQFAATAESLARERRLNELARTLSGVLDLPSVLHSVVRLAVELVGGEGGALGLVAPDGERVNYPYLFNLPEGLRLQSAPKGQGLAWQIILSGASVLQTDYGSLPNALPQWIEAGVHGFIGVPVAAGEAHIGALGLFGLNPHKRFTSRDLALAESIGRQAGLAIQNARLFEQTQRRAAYLSALNEVGRAVSTLLGVDGVLEVIYQQVQRSLPLDVFFVSLYDAETNTVSNPFVMDGGQLYQEPLRPLIEDSHTGRTVRTAAPQLINCTEEELAAKAQHRHGIGDKARPAASMLFAPLLVGTRVIGVISAQSYSLQAFTDEHLALLTGVASQAAIAIENARLFGAEERRAKMLAALHATSLDITLQHDLPTLLRTIVERAARLIGAPSGGLYLCDPDRQEARCMVSYNTWRDYSGTVLKYGEGAAGRVAQTGTPLIIEDYRLWSGRAAAYENQPFTAVLSVPMIWQGQVTGVIDVEYNVETPGRFTQADLELLSQFANQAAIAVENARLLTETQRRAEEQRLLYNAARDFTAGLSEEAALQAIAQHMVGALNVAGCAVSVWEPDQDRVVTLLSYDVEDDMPVAKPGTAYALAGYPATRRVLETRQPFTLHVDDPDADPAESALLRPYDDTALLMLPLSAGEDVFGLIELTRRAGAPRFSESDVRLGQSLAVEAGVALENARLHTTVQERVRELDALLTANSSMLSTLDLDPLLDNILQAALAAIPAAEKGTILLTEITGAHDAAEPSELRLQIRALSGYTDPRVQTFAFAGSDGYSAKAVREKCPLLISDARADPQFRYNGDIPEVREILSAIAVPLMHHAHPLGVISLDATRRAAFTEADLRLLVAFANAAAVAIDNAQLHAEVRALAVTDGLTGLANHRAFQQALETEVARAARYGYPVSLVFLDIDSFKLYNDTFGHPAGNVRLKAIAAHLRVREPDLAARYGGEEFALLLPHTPKDGALVLAEHIRAAAEASAPERSAPGVPVSGYTFSLGVATFPDDGHTPEDLLLAADNAELAAKRAGKNRVITAPPLNHAP